jgi:hypothetical protein
MQSTLPSLGATDPAGIYLSSKRVFGLSLFRLRDPTKLHTHIQCSGILRLAPLLGDQDHSYAKTSLRRTFHRFRRWKCPHDTSDSGCNRTIERCLSNITHLLQSEHTSTCRSDTSTVTLRVVGGDEKGSLKCEAVKYGLKSLGT